MTNKQKSYNRIIFLTLLFCLITGTFLEFLLHRRFVFMWDDLWYSTNLVTGQPLSNLHDIWESQQWHYLNWGGRSITHALLQFIILQGELFADILNLIVTFSLSYFICKLADTKSLLIYNIAFFSLVAFNTDTKQSMFWQSGSTNYLYSTNWILLFLLIYVNQIRVPEKYTSKLLTFLIIPLGLITGWSTENMGPACFLAALLTTLCLIYHSKEKAPLWMWAGIVSSFIGSIFVIVAPGNFVRSTHITTLSFGEILYERLFMLLMAGVSYLFPTLLCLIMFLFLYLYTGNQVQPFQIILLITAVLAYGAMLLSPTFPARASFGIMSLCIVVICSFIKGIIAKSPNYRNGIFIFSLCLWLLGIYNLISCILLPI